MDSSERELVDAFVDAQAEIGDAVVLTDGGNVVHANDAMARILGLSSADQAVRKDLFDWLDPSERSRVTTRLRLRLRGAQGIDHAETQIVRRDGMRVPVDYVARRVHADSDGLVLWIFHDLSRERWTHRELTAAEQKLALLAASAHVAVVTLDAQGNVVQFDEGARRLWGYGPQNAKNLAFTSLFQGTAAPALSAAIGPAIAGGDEPPTRLASTGRRADGSSFPAEILLRVLDGPGPEAVAAVVKDVTERKHAEEQRRQAIIELERANEAKSEFINMAAHELRTPLAPIRAELALLKGSSPQELGKDQRQSIETLSRNLERLSQFVESMLEVTRMQSGRLEIDRAEMDLAKVVRDTAGLFEAAAQYGEVNLEVKVPGTLGLTGDASRLEQVVFNLVSNALKFTPEGGRIVVRVRKTKGAKAVVDVEDTGVGIRKKDFPKLFQPFGQIDKDHQRRQKGSGLGLYICKQIVELHGGKVWVKSPGPKKGSTFGFELPTS